MTALDYFEDEKASSSFSRWLLPALIVSILLHVAFFIWAGSLPILSSEKEVYDKIVPRTFNVERVEIDPKLLEPDPSEKKSPAMAPTAVKVPEEHAAFEKLLSETKAQTPTAPSLDQKILSETPAANARTLKETVTEAQLSGAQSALEDTNSLQQSLLNEKPGAGSATVSDLLAPDTLTGRAIAKSGPIAGGDTPGFSNLDQLLAQTGPLSAETAPILMPTDLLFNYNEFQLRPEAMASLEKLATLIKRNPQAVFQIEGHTDSFGPDDYNLGLSQRRADLVKAWLVGSMNIPADRVTARGYGKTRLIAPASGSIEDQQINRRVEIVIHTAQ